MCRFLPETHTVTTVHQRAIRTLGQAVGINVPPQQEAEQLPLILRTLRETSQAAGGAAPAPLPPACHDLDALEPLSGNERLIEAASRGKALADSYASWIACRTAIAARLPAFQTTKRLVELGANGQHAAMDDIVTGRRLLDEPDPVVPLRQDAAGELRTRLNTAYDAYQAALDQAEATLKADADWQKLSPEDKHTIRATNGLLPVARPVVSSPEDIVSALTARGLSGWADLTRGVPYGVQTALDEAAERARPRVQAVTLPPAGTIIDPAGLDTWLDTVRATLTAALEKGPVRPRF